jgi:hypothetical protein
LSPARSAKHSHSATRHGRVSEPEQTARFLPFGDAYRSGVSLGTGWLAGSLGGAKRIVVSQLAGNGTVKIFSSGSALDGGPAMYLQSPLRHGHGSDFREIGSFNPFSGAAGTRVATTSTTSGANLLVSGVSAEDSTARVVKYELIRPHHKADALEAVRLGEVLAMRGMQQPALLGGD